MCIYCINEDIHSVGVAYAHRSHNFPGVTCCHLHNVKLECACSSCGVEHLMHETSKYYSCFSQRLEPLGNINVENVTDIKYSKFIYEILFSKKRHTTTEARSRAINNRIIDLGLNRKSSINKRTLDIYISRTLKNSALKSKLPYQTFNLDRMSIAAGAIFLFAIFKYIDLYYEYANKSENLS